MAGRAGRKRGAALQTSRWNGRYGASTRTFMRASFGISILQRGALCCLKRACAPVLLTARDGDAHPAIGTCSVKSARACCRCRKAGRRRARAACTCHAHRLLTRNLLADVTFMACYVLRAPWRMSYGAARSAHSADERRRRARTWAAGARRRTLRAAGGTTHFTPAPHPSRQRIHTIAGKKMKEDNVNNNINNNNMKAISIINNNNK